MIVGLGGAKRSGKSTAAAALVADGWHPLNFADPLRDMALAIDPIIDWDGGGPFRYSDALAESDYDHAKVVYPEVRRFLQRLGTDAVRNTFGPNAWVELLARRADAVLVRGGNIVIADMRFRSEASWVRGAGGVCVKIVRPDAGNDGDSHPSEHDLDGWEWDDVIVNDGTVAALHYAVRHIATPTWEHLA